MKIKAITYFNPITIFASLLFCLVVFGSCTSSDEDATQEPETVVAPKEEEIIVDVPTTPTANFANIDFKNWKVTLPIDENKDGSPDEYAPSFLVNFGYQTKEQIKPYMYDDVTDKSIVFYAFPAVSTTNSSYSRSELRELIDPSSTKVNWSLDTGGTMEGKLKMLAVTKDNSSTSYEYHRVIVMQIHGIIKQTDMTKYGFSSNNGPPLLKMFWIDGHLKAYKKNLVKSTTSGSDLLDVSSKTWTDISHDFGYVGYEPFNLKIVATTGKLEITLNDEKPYVFQDISLEKWPFENYFKAGNYLITTDAEAQARIKYYELKVSH